MIGIMPAFLRSRERLFDDVETIVVTSMHERKQLMYDQSDAFVVAPGGIGTLEEIVELLSWKRLDLHAKPVIFLNLDGFWDGFFTLIEHSPDEVLLGDSDHHLDVVVSLHRQPRAGGGAAVLTLSTVVHLKSRLGALYMLPVRPAHGLIARAMATALARPITPP